MMEGVWGKRRKINNKKYEKLQRGMMMGDDKFPHQLARTLARKKMK